MTPERGAMPREAPADRLATRRFDELRAPRARGGLLAESDDGLRAGADRDLNAAPESGLQADVEEVEEAEETEEAESGRAPLSRRMARAGVEWTIIAASAILLAMLIESFFVQAFSIPSGSMAPTLESGDRVMVYKLGYRFGDVGRGDVVVFRMSEGPSYSEDLIKRVVAVGGDTFEIIGGAVYVNDEAIDEPYLAYTAITNPKAPIAHCENPAVAERCVVPPGRLLVLGDNREFSRDGRYFGTIDEDDVVGRAFMKYWPPSSFGPM